MVGEDDKHYFWRLANEALLECAKRDVRARNEQFLWNARRALEAMLLALLEPDAPRGRSPELHVLFDLVKQRKLLKPNAFLHGEFVKDLGNVGTHVQRRDKAPGEREVSSAAAALANFVGAVREQYPESFLPGVDEALKALRRSGSEHPPPSQERAMLRSELDRLRSEYATLLHERDGLRALASRANEEREAVRAQLQAKAPIPPTTKRQPPLRAVTWALAAALVGAIIASVAWQVRDRASVVSATAPETSSRFVEPMALAAPSSASDAGVPPAPSLGSAALAGSASTTGGPEPKSCPDGRAFIPGADFDLLQPKRDRWPRPGAPSVHVSTRAFCLDKGAVRVGELGECVKAGKCDVVRGDKTCSPNTDAKAIANCVSAQVAAQYCQFRSGRLPSVAEWETEVRGSHRVDRGSDYEWTSDIFPAAVLNRGPGNEDMRMLRQKLSDLKNPGYEWHHAERDSRRADIVFRCVSDPVAPDGNR